MDPVTTVLGGVLVAVVSGAIGKTLGSNGKMSENHCEEKRQSCQTIVITKIDNVARKVDDLTSIVNNKLLGL